MDNKEITNSKNIAVLDSIINKICHHFSVNINSFKTYDLHKKRPFMIEKNGVTVDVDEYPFYCFYTTPEDSDKAFCIDVVNINEVKIEAICLSNLVNDILSELNSIRSINVFTENHYATVKVEDEEIKAKHIPLVIYGEEEIKKTLNSLELNAVYYFRVTDYGDRITLWIRSGEHPFFDKKFCDLTIEI